MKHLDQTPLFPSEIYDMIPEVLKEGVKLYSHQRDKDLFLISALTVGSSCMPRLTGLYHISQVHANLYTLVLAPAGSGKEPMKHAASLIDDIHDVLRMEQKVGDYIPGIIIPGNITSSSLMGILASYPCHNGIVIETEADTLGKALSQEHGDFSDILRKAYHHERVSIARVKDFQLKEIAEPKLSMLLSGTPDQLEGIVSSVSNGLFSRFVFYAFAVPIEWKDVTPTNKNDYKEKLAPVRHEFLEIYKRYSIEDYSFTLTNEQWVLLNKKFEPLLIQLVNVAGEEVSSVVKRLGLIGFRLCMVLSAMRQYRDLEGSKIICSEEDFETAMRMVDVLMQHSVFVFENTVKESTTKGKFDRFYDGLPLGEFRRQSAILIASALGISERTADKYLSIFKDRGLLYYPDYNTYIKPDVQSLQSEQSPESQE